MWLIALGLPLPYSCDVRFREHQDLHMSMSVHSKRPKHNKEKSATIAAFTVEGDCVLDFCLE